MARESESQLRAGQERIERERQQFLELQKIRQAAEQDERQHRDEIEAKERKLIEDKARAQRELERSEEKLLRQWDKQYKAEDKAARDKKRQLKEQQTARDKDQRAREKLDRDIVRASDREKRTKEKLIRDEQRAQDRAQRAADKLVRTNQRAADKAQRDADKLQKSNQRAADKLKRDTDRQQRQQTRAADKAARDASRQQQKDLNGIAANIQNSISAKASQLATGGPAGRAKAAQYMNVIGPKMIQQAQAAYMAQNRSGGTGGMQFGGAAGSSNAHALLTPPPKASLLSRISDKAAGGVDQVRQFRDDYHEVNNSSLLDKLSLALKGNGKMVAAGAAASAATAGIGFAAKSASGAIGLLKDVFMTTWNYIDTKVLPTTSMLNRSLGATTPGMKSLRNEAMSTALQFERLGLGFEHGAQTANDLALGLKAASIPKGLMNSLVKVSEYVGVGGEQAGKLGRSFLSTGATTENLGATIDKVMGQSAKAAKEFGVPINMVRKEFAANIDLVQRWGTDNTQAFNRAIAKAESYGLSIRELEGTFGKSLDTFETTSDVASKLNAAFGTNLDSVKLLMQNSDDRMETIRSAVRNAGFEWDHASKFAKNLLMSTLQIKDETEGASIFGSQKDRAAAMAKIKDQKMIANGMDEWKRALGSLGTQLTSVEQLTRNLFMAIGDVVSKLLGFNSGIDGTKQGVKVFETFMENLTKKIQEFARSLPNNKDGFGPTVIAWVNDLSTSLGNARDLVRDIKNYFQDLSMVGEGAATSIADQFEKLYREGGTPQDFAAVKARMDENPLFAPKQKAMTQAKIERDLGLNHEQVVRFLEKPADVQANQQMLSALSAKAQGLNYGVYDPDKIVLNLIINGNAIEIPVLGGAVQQATKH